MMYQRGQYGDERRQRGVILVVSLLMIAVLALLAAASINLGSGEMLIVGNKQAQRASASAADAVIENSISNLNAFTAPAPLTETRDGINVTRTAPVCTADTTVAGFSLTNPLALQHNYYEFEVTASDPKTGAQSHIRAGVRILQNADSC